MLAPEGFPILLHSTTRGSVDVAAKAAGCLYQAVKHKEGQVDILTPKRARVLLCCSQLSFLPPDIAHTDSRNQRNTPKRRSSLVRLRPLRLRPLWQKHAS
jgi:hypothetical protein